jgi:Uma2 family endonuclease
VHHYTYADYLALEAASNVKHEFLDGEIYAMAGGTFDHAALSVSVSGALLALLRGGPCRVFSSDLRVRVLATGLTTYPDVTVVCGEIECDPESGDTAVNPRVVAEVLSDSTENYDRGIKLRHYQQIPALGSIVLVSQRRRRIEVWERRVRESWEHRSYDAGDTAHVSSIDAMLAVDEIYRDALGSD